MSQEESQVQDKVRDAIEAIAKCSVDDIGAGIQDAVRIALQEIDALEGTIAELEDERDELKTEAEATTGDVSDAVNRFLDEVDRPVGTREFAIPVERTTVKQAIVGLYDAVGRPL